MEISWIAIALSVALTIAVSLLVWSVRQNKELEWKVESQERTIDTLNLTIRVYNENAAVENQEFHNMADKIARLQKEIDKKNKLIDQFNRASSRTMNAILKHYIETLKYANDKRVQDSQLKPIIINETIP